MSRARVTILVSIALAMVVAGWTLSRSPVRVVLTSAAGEEEVASTLGNAAACQSDETVPAGATAIRLQMGAAFGPAVRLRAYSGSRVLTEGRRAADWVATSVTVPVRPLNRTVRHVKLCFATEANSEPVHLYGLHTSQQDAAVAPGGQPLSGRVTVEYLATDRGSWWTHATSVARRMGLGKALSGTWVALLAAMLAAAMATLIIRLAWRELP